MASCGVVGGDADRSISNDFDSWLDTSIHMDMRVIEHVNQIGVFVIYLYRNEYVFCLIDCCKCFYLTFY